MKKRIFTLMMAFLAIAGNAVWGQENINITGIETQLPTPSQGTGWKLTHEDIGTAGNKLVISQSGKYVITDAADAAADNSNIQIIVNGNLEDVEITVKNVKTNAQLNNNLDGAETDDKYSNRCAFEINSGTTVTLNWEGTNKFWSSPERAGINVKPGATLILNDEDNSGTLEAGSLCNGGQAHTYGAGIGGDQVEPNFGTIIIEKGQINARCESKGNSYSKFDALAAGIGGGYSDTETSTEGTIIIKGGTIEAASWSVDDGSAYSLSNLGNQYSYGAGIGGGWKGTCTNIAILGGKVTANSYSGNDIGVGYEYYGGEGITKGIVIGKWDENTNFPEITGDIINQTNIADGRDGQDTPSIKGNVTMPAETQIYVEYGWGDVSNFKSYNIDLKQTSLTEEGEDGEHASQGDVTKYAYYYYGPEQSFTVEDLSCDDGHLFLGWYEENNQHYVSSKEGSATFTMPNIIPRSTTTKYYYSVWVDNRHEIAVATGTSWTENATITPKISYEPDYTNGPDVLSSLHFTLSSYDGNKNQPEELKGLKFTNNQLIGTPTLQGDNTYKKIEVKAKVKLGNDGGEKEISIPITIVEEKMINFVDIAAKLHIYNGLPHNQRQVGTGTSEDYVLDVKMTKDIMGDPLPDGDIVPLVEGVDYYISKVDYRSGNSEETLPATGEQSVSIVNAGTYSSIEITALNATFDSDLTPIQTGKYSLPKEKVIVVAQRPMNISISFNKESIEEDEELTWDDDVTVNIEKMTSGRGLVTDEDIKVTGTINYVLNEEGTTATVTIANIKIEDGQTFKQSNYTINVNGTEYSEGVEIEIPESDVPVVSSSTGGSFNDHRYQLFLANKDYLKTDEKTVEYYEDLKLELFSRHNKKYTDAGGSFTVWYEKDGVANPGGYRLFWSKSGERGDYQEVKFDEVSGYYQIRNVQSDVYVKIYDADGFPVANEAITAQDFRAYAQPNKIIIITPELTDVQIISMAGAVVATDKVTGHREFANLAEGVYIVRMGETIVKLQVRN